MELTIKYGKRFEVNRILFTLERLDWYKLHNYKPILPENIKTKEQVIGFVNNNFNEEEYKSKEGELSKNYKKINKKFTEKLMNSFPNLPKEIEVILTKYGMGGSYSLPNKVIINIKSKKSVIDILKHEILHLLCEEEVIEKGMSQEEKEELIRNLEKKF